jgi:hypothetical protein
MTSQEIADWLAAREDDRLRTAFTSFPPNERAVNNNLEQTRKRIREMMNAQERTLVEGAATNELR